MDCSLPGSSLHGILQGRVLEWVAISFSRGSSRARDRTPVSCIPGRCFNLWATREAGCAKLSYESYWIIATSFQNKIWCWDINYWTLASFYTETKGLNFPGSLAGKESACNEGDPSLIPGLRRSPGEEKRLPTPVFWPGEFNGLYSPRGLRVRHDWSTFTFTFQRTERLSTHSHVFRTVNEYVWCYSAMFSTRKQMFFFLEIITDIYVHWSSEC